MSKVSRELLKNYIMEYNFKPSNYVLTAMKEMFAETLQETSEAEINGYLFGL